MRGTGARSRTSPPLRAALLGVTAAAVLTACGGGSGTTSATGSSSAPPPASSSSSAPASSAPAGGAAADSDFCTQARSFAAEAGQALAGGNSPDVAQQLQTLVGRLKSIDPPPAIASDWQSAVASLQQFAQAYQGVDLNDPQQLAQLQQRLAPLVQQLSASGDRVDTYLQTQCGISTGDTSGTAAPSS